MARNRPFDGRDFGDLVESGCGFEDRTWIICDQYRGRRDPSEAPGFGNVPGEPMDLGMLDAFFNLKYKGNTWFEGLEASRCGGCDEDKNAHPVIRLSFDGIEGPYEEFVSAVRRRISDLYREHLDDLDGRISENDMNAVMDFIDGKPTHLLYLGPLNILASLLYEVHGEKAVMIPESMDVPFDSSRDPEEAMMIEVFVEDMVAIAVGSPHLRFFFELSSIERSFSDLSWDPIAIVKS